VSEIRPNLAARLEVVLKTALRSGALISVAIPGLPSRLEPGSTPDPFHSDELLPIGHDGARISSVVVKALQIALGHAKRKAVSVTVREETLRQIKEPVQVWVMLVSRRGRPPVYLKGMFERAGIVILLSVHESDREVR
jgi:hypothetical protein